jgi:hypothetical protein
MDARPAVFKTVCGLWKPERLRARVFYIWWRLRLALDKRRKSIASWRVPVLTAATDAAPNALQDVEGQLGSPTGIPSGEAAWNRIDGPMQLGLGGAGGAGSSPVRDLT